MGIELTKETYKFSQGLPDEEKFGLRSQMVRAAVSIPANIAEGSSRSSNKEFIRFLEYSIGSSFELETLILLANDIYGIRSSFILDSLQKIQSKTNAFRSTVMKFSNSKIV